MSGFSIAYAGFFYSGFGNWWLGLLQAIKDWDGDSKSLDQIKELPGQRESRKLRHWFDLAVNAIIYHQNAVIAMTGYVEQFDILSVNSQPDSQPVFELLNRDDEVEIIQKVVNLAGSFDKPLFVSLMEKGN